MAKIICTEEEYEKLSIVLDDNPQFLSDITVEYEITNPSYRDIRLGSGLGITCAECPCSQHGPCRGECFEHTC